MELAPEIEFNTILHNAQDMLKHNAHVKEFVLCAHAYLSLWMGNERIVQRRDIQVWELWTRMNEIIRGEIFKKEPPTLFGIPIKVKNDLGEFCTGWNAVTAIV